MENEDKDWKLNLRYGKLHTPFKHLTLIAQGVAGDLQGGFTCPPGNAFMGMKVWASSDEEAAAMIQAIGYQIGFKVTGDIQIYYTDPLEPPKDNPYGYDITFSPFNESKAQEAPG